MDIKIFKSKKVLEIWVNNQKSSSYPIGIGKNQTGTKEKEGDFKTPEGEYKVIVKNPKSQYHLSVGLDYPNPHDAENGLKNNIISKEEYEKIIRAHENNTRIPWSTPLGGAIYIHGALEEQDWSEGCIRMYNNDIESIYSTIEKGTKVNIYS